MGSFAQESCTREVVPRLFNMFKSIAETIVVFYATFKKEQWEN